MIKKILTTIFSIILVASMLPLEVFSYTEENVIKVINENKDDEYELYQILITDEEGYPQFGESFDFDEGELASNIKIITDEIIENEEWDSKDLSDLIGMKTEPLTPDKSLKDIKYTGCPAGTYLFIKKDSENIGFVFDYNEEGLELDAKLLDDAEKNSAAKSETKLKSESKNSDNKEEAENSQSVSKQVTEAAENTITEAVEDKTAEEKAEVKEEKVEDSEDNKADVQEEKTEKESKKEETVENKKENKSEDKTEEKASEESPADIAAQDTKKLSLKQRFKNSIGLAEEDLATDVVIEKFDLVMEDGKSNGAWEEKPDGSKEWVVRPTYYNTTDWLSLYYKLDYAFSATGHYPAESIEIRVPRHIVKTQNYLGEETVSTIGIELSVPEYPNYNSASGFSYKEDEETDEYILTNAIDIDGGAQGFFEFLCHSSNNPGNFKDRSPQVPIQATLKINTGDEGVKEAESDVINWTVDTYANINSTTKTFKRKYDEWLPEWGTPPEDADDYFYVTYAVKIDMASNRTQKYTLGISDTNWDEDFAYGYLYNTSTTSVTPVAGGSAVTIPTIAVVSNNYTDMMSSFWRNTMADNKIRKISLNELNEWTTGVGIADNWRYIYADVLARYPKTMAEGLEEYDVENTVNVTCHPYDGVDDVSTATDSVRQTIRDIDFDAPPGNNNVEKWSGLSYYDLTKLAENKSDARDVYYYSRYTQSNYVSTLKEGGNPENEDDYGIRKNHMEFIDDMVYLGEDDTSFLTGDDYEFSSLGYRRRGSASSASPYLSFYNWELDPSTYEYKQTQDVFANGKIRPIVESETIKLWAKIDDEWKRIATLAPTSSSTENTLYYKWKDLDSCIDTSKGNQESSRSSTATENTIYLPYLLFKDNSNITGLKVTLDDSHYRVTLNDFYVYLRIKRSERVRNWAQRQIDSGATSGSIINVSTTYVTDEDGNFLAIPGTISGSSNINAAMRAHDEAEYGQVLYHARATDYLYPSQKYASIAKSVTNNKNNALKEIYELDYTISQKETFTGFDSNALMPSSGRLNEDYYNELLDEETLHEWNGGVFYDLLPRGLSFEGIKSVTRSINSSGSYSNTGIGQPVSNGLYYGSTTYTSNYESELIKNYKDSGRDMLIVRIKEPAGLQVNTYNDAATLYYSVTFHASYAWDSIYDYGSKLRNIVAFETSDDELSDGKQTNVYKDGAPLENSSAYPFANWKNAERVLMNDLSDVDYDKRKYDYAYVDYNINAVVSGSSGLYKKVKGRTGDFSESAETGAGEKYQYKVRYASEAATNTSQMIFFDSLENYTPQGVESQWRGVFQGIDLSQLRDKGIAPVVYYTTIPNISIEDHHDLEETYTDDDTGEEKFIWTTTKPANELITGWAVDARKDNEGDDFVLTPKQSISFIIDMLPVADNVVQRYLDGEKAYNNIYLSSVITVNNVAADNFVHQNYTEISLYVPTKTIHGTKKWKGEDRDDIPDEVQIELYRNGEKIDETTAKKSENWVFDFENMPLTDDSGVPYDYTIKEVQIPDWRTTFKKDDGTLNGLAITFDKNFSTYDSNDYLRIYYEANGVINVLSGSQAGASSDSGKFYGQKGSAYNLAGKTITIPSKHVWFYWHTNNTKSDYGFKIEDISAARVPEFSSYSTATLPAFDVKDAVHETPETRHIYYHSDDQLWEYDAREFMYYDVINTQMFRDIEGQKIWEKDVDTRPQPESIIVRLYRDGIPYKYQVVDESTDWKYSFKNEPIFGPDRFTEYVYTVREDPVEGYDASYSTACTGVAITFGDEFKTESTCDYLKVYYRDPVDNSIKQLMGQGAYSTTGFCGSGDNMAGRTIYVPSGEVYFYWRTDGSVVYYGFDIVNIRKVEDDLSFVESEPATLPSYTPAAININDVSTYPKTPHPTYTNSKNQMWKLDIPTYELTDVSELYSEVNITNTANFIDIPVVKVWDDEGVESSRPTSVTFDLYNENAPDTVLDSLTLTSSNAVDSHKWKGVFEELPAKNLDGTDAVYKVREHPVEGYSTVYGSEKPYTRIHFNNQSTTYNSNDNVKIYYKDGDKTKQLLTNSGGTMFYGSSLLQNASIVIPSKEFWVQFTSDSSSNNYGIKVDSVEFIDALDINIHSQETTLPNFSNSTKEEFDIGSNYPETSHNYANSSNLVWHFNADEGMSNRYVTNVSEKTNIPFRKIWDDKGFENLRPSSITFNLYDESKPDVVVATKTVTKSEFGATTAEWAGAFSGVPKYDEDNNPITYIVKEEPVAKYETFYEGSYYSGDFNALKIKFKETVPSTYRIIYEYNGYCYYRDVEVEGQEVTIPGKLFYIYKYSGTADAEIESITPAQITESATDYMLQKGTYTATSTPITASENIKLESGTLKYEYKESSKPVTRNVYNHMNVPVSKEWNDEGYERLRPESLTVTLYNEDDLNTPLGTIELTADNNWKGSFHDLPKYDSNGNIISYVIKEGNVENYRQISSASFSHNANPNGFTAIKFGPKFATESTGCDWVSFYYKDASGNYRILTGQGSTSGKWGGSETSSTSLKNKTIYIPSNEVYLYWRSDGSSVAYGFDVVDISYVYTAPVTITSNSASLPSATMKTDALPHTSHNYDNRETHMWKINSVSTASLTNENIVIDVPATKIWNDEGAEASRPEEILLELYNDKTGQKVAEHTLTADDAVNGYTWEYIFRELPKYNDDDTLASYHVREVLTDTAVNYTTRYKLSKKGGVMVTFPTNESQYGSTYVVYKDGFFWRTGYVNMNDGYKVYLPTDKFYVFYYQNGNSSYETVPRIESIEPLSGDIELPANGIRYDYGTYSGTSTNYYNTGSGSGNTDDSFAELTGGYGSIKWLFYNMSGLYSSTWDSTAQKYNYTLRVNVDTKKVTSGTQMTDSFNTPSGVIYEVDASEYASSEEPENGFLYVENTTDRTSVPVTKIWADETAENRPDSITVNLYRGEEVIDTMELSEANNWKGIFEDLPKYDAQGDVINYKVREENVPEGYKVSYRTSNTNKKLIGLRLRGAYNSNGTHGSYSSRTTGNRSSGFYYYLSYKNKNNGKWYTYNYFSWSSDLLIPADEFKISMYFFGNAGDNFNAKMGFKGVEPIYEGDIPFNIPDRGVQVSSLDSSQIVANYDAFSYSFTNSGQGPYNASWENIYYGASHISETEEQHQGDVPQIELTGPGDKNTGKTIHWSWDYSRADEYYFADNIITNVENVTSIPVQKQWDDAGYESKRPEKILVDLKEKGSDTVISTVELTEDNSWRSEFTGIPRWNESGDEIQYEASERPVANYLTTYHNSSDRELVGLRLNLSDYYYMNGNSYIFWYDSQEAVWRYTSGYNYNYSVIIPSTEFYVATSMMSSSPSNDTETFGAEEVYPVYRDELPDGYTIPPQGVYISQSNGIANSTSRFATSTSSISPWASFLGGGGTYDVHWYDDDNIEERHNGEDAVLSLSKDVEWATNKIIHWSYDKDLETECDNLIKNKINLTSLPFEKHWADEGHEDSRPKSLTFGVYNVSDQTNPVATKELTSADQDENDSNKWVGVFEDLPKYDTDGTLIKYTVKELTEVENYAVSYKSDKTLNQVVGLNIRGGYNVNGPVYYYYKDEQGRIKYITGFTWNSTYFIPATEFWVATANYSTSSNTVIDLDVTPVFQSDVEAGLKGNPINHSTTYDDSASGAPFGSGVQGGVISSGYLSSITDYDVVNSNEGIHLEIPASQNTGDAAVVHYTYDESDYTFRHSIITNTWSRKSISVRKTWDVGGVNSRKYDVILDLYNEQDMSKAVSTITLTANDAVSDDTWEGIFENVPEYNDDGTYAKYIIKERNTDMDYVTTYLQKNDGTGVRFKFRDDLWAGNWYTPTGGNNLLLYYKYNGQLYLFDGVFSYYEYTLPTTEFWLVGYNKSSAVYGEEAKPSKMRYYIKDIEAVDYTGDAMTSQVLSNARLIDSPSYSVGSQSPILINEENLENIDTYETDLEKILAYEANKNNGYYVYNQSAIESNAVDFYASEKPYAVYENGDGGIVHYSYYDGQTTERVAANTVKNKFRDDNVNLKVSKTVTGGMSNSDDMFDFTVNIKGAETGHEYRTKKNGTYDDSLSLTTNDEGNGTLTFKLKHGENIEIIGLPYDTEYSVSEAASEYLASYTIDRYGDTGERNYGTAANTTQNTALATGTKHLRGNQEVAYTNSLSSIVPTGIDTTSYILLLLVIILLVVMAVKNHKNRKSAPN